MMKKLKKLSSVLAAIAVLMSSIVVSTTVSAADTYITKEVVDDIYNNGYTTAITYTDAAGDGYLHKLYIKANTALGLPSGKYGMFPYVHRVDGQDIPSAYAVWYSENDMDTFYMDALLMPENSSDAFVNSSYSFYYSSDNKNWTLASFTIGASAKKDATWFVNRRLTVSNLPAGTKYIKFLSLNVNSTKDSGYMMGFTRVGYTYQQLLVDPVITAEYKNLYGVYANPITDGAKITRDAQVKITNIDDEASGGSISVKKDGSSVNAADYYNSSSGCYEFTQDGEYQIAASNKAGAVSLSFTLEKVTEEPVVTRTVVDDFYNTGKPKVYEITSHYADSTSLYSLGVKQDTKLLPEGKYYMFPYVHNFNEPKVYATWYSDIGMESFWIDAFLNPDKSDETFIRSSYSFYYSYDNKEWTKADFSIGESRNGDGNWFVTRRLTVGKIPDGVKYVRYASLCTDATKGSGYMMGLVRAGYTVYAVAPQILANTVDALGYFTSPVCDGATVAAKTKIEFSDLTEEVNGVYSVTKDGSPYTLPADGILTEDGAYVITAENIKGKETLSFSIASSNSAVASEKYDFSGGAESAQADYDKLLGITPDGASADFTKGDGHIIVNDTAAVKNQNKKWWGLREGGTKLTVGSDSKGYKKDGYFYFLNQGSDGTKYTGFSITYTVARQSGNPTDAYFSVYTADKYNGSYRLVEPVYVERDEVVGDPAVNVCHATYYLGGEATVVKIEFHPQAPDVASSYWLGSFLSILDLTKLSMPTATAATVDGSTVLVDNQVTQKNVRISVANELYYFIEKDGKLCDKPANGILTEDGFYTLTAVNAAGASKVSFYIAKEAPAIQLIDCNGNYLTSGAVTEDDVKAIFYNAETATTTLNGEPYSFASELVLDLNGNYILTAENSKGTFRYDFQLSRPLPTIKAYNFQGTQVAEGAKIVTSVTFNATLADSVKITLNGKEYKLGEENKLTEEGAYKIEAVNKAGSTVLNFTLKYNPPLPEIPHAGDTVVSLNYHTIGSRSWTKWLYKYESVLMDNAKALQSSWTGFTGSCVHPSIADDSECYAIYKAPGFKSFHYYVGTAPEFKKGIENIYALSASVNGKDYEELEFTVEQDISYITTGWKLYRLVAKDIPEGARYIRVDFDMTGASASFATAVTRAEFSYDKENFGKLDVDDLLFMIGDSYDGDTVKIDLYNDGTVIPKRVFEALYGSDITLEVDLYNKQTEKLEYMLSFNGMGIDEAMDFNTGMSLGDNEAVKKVKPSDSNALGINFSQKGPWTMEVSASLYVPESLAAGVTYAFYGYADGELSLLTKAKLNSKGGLLTFSSNSYADFVLSAVTDLVKDDAGSEDYDDSYEDNIIDADISEDEADNAEDDPLYMMTVSRRRKLSIASGSGIVLPLIIIGAAILVIAAAAVTLIILNKKGIIFNKKGNL